MLTIHVSGQELFDEDSQKFVTQPGFVLNLEHSLLALSEWESKWEQPFLGPGERSQEQLFDYIRCMIVSRDLPPDVIPRLSDEDVLLITKYIEKKMTATWFNNDGKKSANSEIITSELIYYWMTMYKIPFECERWHLNRLFTLIQVCDVKQSPPKKRSPQEAAQRNREINERNRARFATSG